jgi:PIN domain nuclease of toxin-antitoxin system
MRILLDTSILLWWLNQSRDLSQASRELIADPENTIFVSAATVWEARIKESIGKLRLPPEFEKVLASEDFEHLPITIPHAHAAGRLPPHHRDPFDRMLVAQAHIEKLRLLTSDAGLAVYRVDLIRA